MKLIPCMLIVFMLPCILLAEGDSTTKHFSLQIDHKTQEITAWCTIPQVNKPDVIISATKSNQFDKVQITKRSSTRALSLTETDQQIITKLMENIEKNNKESSKAYITCASTLEYSQSFH